MSDDDKFFNGLMKGLQEGIDFVKGKDTGATRKKVQYKSFKPVKKFSAQEIKQIRAKLNFSQPVFAAFLGVNVDTLRRWEQDLVQVGGANSRLLELISQDKHQDIIEEFELKKA